MIYYKKKAQQDVGATAIEYGLIASLISVLAVGGMSAVGINLSNTYCKISKHLGGSGECSGSGSSGTGGNGSSAGSGNSTTGNEGNNSTIPTSITNKEDMDNLIKSLSEDFDGRYLDTSLGGTDGFSELPLPAGISRRLLSQMTDYNQNNPDDQITNVFGLYDGLTQKPITSWSKASQGLNDAINNAGYIENNIHTGNNGRDFEFTTQHGRVYTIDSLLGTMAEQLPTGQ